MGKIGREETLALFENHSLSGSQTHTVPSAPDNIISHHLRGEIPANIMGNPEKELGGGGRHGVGSDGNCLV